MKFKHVRNATSILTYNDINILIDPCLAKKNSFRNVPIKRRNVLELLKKEHPLSNINTDMSEILDCDIILSTHRHFDHFDKKAKALLNKDKPIFCQKCDEKHFRRECFQNVVPIENEVNYKNIRIIRVHANHGKWGGESSGYILIAPNEPVVYISGDTIYTDETKKTILKYQPQVIIINGGGARVFSTPLIMDIDDIEETLRVKPDTSFIIVHLDTINHCLVTRKRLEEYFDFEKLKELNVKQFFVPNDNDVIQLLD